MSRAKRKQVRRNRRRRALRRFEELCAKSIAPLFNPWPLNLMAVETVSREELLRRYPPADAYEYPWPPLKLPNHPGRIKI